MTILTSAPPIKINFNKDLLSMPTFWFSAEKLRKIGDWLLKKIDSAEFNKFPATIEKLRQQHKHFMELYERAKIKERENKDKAYIKAKMFGYRPEYVNYKGPDLFGRLEHRVETSVNDRRNNKI